MIFLKYQDIKTLRVNCFKLENIMNFKSIEIKFKNIAMDKNKSRQLSVCGIIFCYVWNEYSYASVGLPRSHVYRETRKRTAFHRCHWNDKAVLTVSWHLPHIPPHLTIYGGNVLFRDHFFRYHSYNHWWPDAVPQQPTDSHIFYS